MKLTNLLSVLVISISAHCAELSTPAYEDIDFPDGEPASKLEIQLGRVLFFDPRLSSNFQQSCATCHNPDLGFADGLSKSRGVLGKVLDRHTPHLINVAFASVLHWGGEVESLEKQVLKPITAKTEMNLPISELITRLAGVPYYVEQFDELYGKKGLNSTNLAKAIAAFERTIISNNSAFDRYIAGELSALSPAQIRGLGLFKNKAGCVACHDGANFTDDSFHNTGVSTDDPGRYLVFADETLKYAFKTPGLRNVAHTAPYMHDGSLASLEQVIEFYDRGGGKTKNKDRLIKPLHLTALEKSDLLAFLGSLSSHIDTRRPEIP